jgi:hypothetical protein
LYPAHTPISFDLEAQLISGFFRLNDQSDKKATAVLGRVFFHSRFSAETPELTIFATARVSNSMHRCYIENTEHIVYLRLFFKV